MINAVSHTRCRACGTTLPVAFLDLGMQPLANNLCTPAEHRDDVFPLRLSRCPACGLLQLDTVVDPAAMFNHYLYTPSQSRQTLAHFEDLATIATARCRGGLVVDIGSNDGALLGMLKARGWRVVGVDPARNLVDQANARGIPTVLGFFDEATVSALLAAYGPADLITANNVFAHTPDWHAFMRCTARLLGPDGRVAIEFPYGPTMLRNGTYDLCYHEHYSYPAVGPVRLLAAQYGLIVQDVEQLPTVHGGSIRLWLGVGVRLPSPVTPLDALERTTYSTYACDQFAANVLRARHSFVHTIRALRRRGRRVVGYTAPAKAVTMVEFCGVGGDIAQITDDNALKHGRLLPVSHVPIVATAPSAGDVAIVFAWNVADDIMDRLPRGVDVVIPMPAVQYRVRQ